MTRSALIACILLGSSTPTLADATVPVGVHKAFLHLDRADSADPALVIALGSLGLVPGYTIQLAPVGDWDAGPGGDTQTALLGLFSGSSTLLEPALLHRVPGAIDAGLYNYSGPTWPNGEPTDILEDFAITAPGLTVVIPPGATHLFVTAADIYYTDNDDPDGDLAVAITLVSTTAVESGSDASSRWGLGARPNPFRERTAIAFDTRIAGTMRLTVHDVAGRCVRTLVAGPLPAGSHRIAWDGRDESGHRVPPGSYFARLGDGDRAESVRVNLVR